MEELLVNVMVSKWVALMGYCLDVLVADLTVDSMDTVTVSLTVGL